LWTLQVATVPLFRGDWTPNTTFALGDIVVVDSYVYYLCSTEHTSSATFPPDAANWQLIFDASQAVDDAQAAADAAEVSATEAAASAGSAATDAASANASKNQALASATSASGSASDAATSASAAATSASNAATSEANAAAAAANLRGTSTTPNTISLGAKTFTTQAGKQFDAGNFMTIVDVSNVNNVLSGQVTSYSGTTLQINVTDANGGGSSSNWNLFVSGSSGVDGSPGIAWKGTWSAATAYQINDAVITASGSSYICVNPHTNSPPPSANWNLLAQGGSVAIADDSVLPQMLDADTAPKQLLMRDRLNFASRSGDTMTGHLKLPTGPAADEAVRKDYVDAADTALSNSATAALALKADIASPIFTGDPKAPTPAVNDNDTSIATTAYVQGQAASAAPLMDGAVAVGTSAKWAREDHRHPTDNTLAPLASPTFTGNPTAPTPAPGDSDTSIATTAFVQGAISTSTTNKVDKAGDTMTGDLTISKDRPALVLNRTNNTSISVISGKRNGLDRWAIGLGDGTVESGGNVGSYFNLYRYDDAGNYIDAPLQINRSTGLASIKGDPIAALGVATKQYVDAIPTSHGQVRFEYVSATQVRLSPYNGSAIKIAGVTYNLTAPILATRTSAFVNGVAGQTLGVTTTYFVYLFDSGGGVLALDFTTTGHSQDTTAGNVGVEIKTGAPTRTLVGMVRTHTDGTFQDNVSFRYVASWFNRRQRPFQGASGNTSGNATAVTAFAYPCVVLCWAGDMVEATYMQSAANSQAGQFGGICVSISDPNSAATLMSGLSYSWVMLANATSVASLGTIQISLDGMHQIGMAYMSSVSSNSFYLQNNNLFGWVIQ